MASPTLKNTLHTIRRLGWRWWLPWMTGTAVLLAGALIIAFATGAPAGATSQARGVDASDITFGNADSDTVIVEYSDFECQFCAGYAEILTVLREKYKDKVLFVYRFFPLENHPHSMIAARAAYAAHLQGQFWEMHDLIFQNQEQWVDSEDPAPLFQAYAQTLGLDLNEFRVDMDADATIAFITAQKAEGKAAGVEHTPWFVINGIVETPLNLAEFEAILDKQP